MLEELCDQWTEKLKTSHFALQVDEAIDVDKDEYLITYVQYVLENNEYKGTFFVLQTYEW